MVHREKNKKSFLANVVEFIGLILLVFLIRTIGFGLYQVPTGSMETTMLVGERFFADKFSYLFRKPRHGEVIAFNEPPMFYRYSDNKLKNLFERYVWGPSNWTKRVIGVPGDELRGVIEEGKPVIYRNGKKLEEPYLNKYPLIEVWREDPKDIEAQLKRKVETWMLYGYDMDQIRGALQQEERHCVTLKSYDPDVNFVDQYFYRINPSWIVYDADNKSKTRWPGTPIYPRHSGMDRVQAGKNFWDGSDEFYVKLGDNEYWGMGDNRLGSKDSRVFGPITRDLIHGRIVFRLWSHDSDEAWWIVDLFKHPIDFWSRMRWGRFFQIIR